MRYFYRFSLISFSSTIVDLGAFNLLLWSWAGPTPVFIFAGFKGLSFILAVINSYFFNSRWVFNTEKNFTQLDTIREFKRFTKFLSINILALGINITVAIIAFRLLQFSEWSEVYLANIAAILGSLGGLLINFRGYKKLFAVIK